MKRKHKTYSRPKRPFDKTRIDEEVGIVKDFGLKNKKEIWMAEAKVKVMREKAKKLISAGPDEQEKLFGQLKTVGFEVNSIADILSLEKKDYLRRRLQTIVAKKFSLTLKTARQIIVHKKVLVDGKSVNSPSYIVPVTLENKLTLKPMKKKVVKKEKSSEEKNE